MQGRPFLARMNGDGGDGLDGQGAVVEREEWIAASHAKSAVTTRGVLTGILGALEVIDGDFHGTAIIETNTRVDECGCTVGQLVH